MYLFVYSNIENSNYHGSHSLYFYTVVIIHSIYNAFRQGLSFSLSGHSVTIKTVIRVACLCFHTPGRK